MNKVDEYTLPGLALAIIITFLTVYGAMALVVAIGNLL